MSFFPNSRLRSNIDNHTHALLEASRTTVEFLARSVLTQHKLKSVFPVTKGCVLGINPKDNLRGVYTVGRIYKNDPICLYYGIRR